MSAEMAMRFAAALWLFWYTHGHVTEARRWLRRALDAGPDEPSEIRARLLAGAGYLAAEQYDDEAIGLLEASLACAKAIGAPATAAIAAAQLCGVRGELERGASAGEILAIGEEAVALARQAGDDFVLAIALNNLGVATHMLLGDAERTRSYYEESLELRRRIGDMSRIALSLGNLGWLALLDGDAARAGALYAEAADIATALGDKRNISHARGGLGSVAYFEGRWDDAEEHTRASLRLYRETRDEARDGRRALCPRRYCGSQGRCRTSGSTRSRWRTSTRAGRTRDIAGCLSPPTERRARPGRVRRGDVATSVRGGSGDEP